MFDPKNDYALNKRDPNAIVYIDSSGTLVRLTPEDFSSVEEFQRWKVWSDENYHMTEKEVEVFYYHRLSLTALLEQAAIIQSPEEILLDLQEEREHQELCRLLMTGIDSCLTPTQHRRLWLYWVNGLTVRQIAQAEGVSHPSIVESLMSARKRLQKFLENRD